MWFRRADDCGCRKSGQGTGTGLAVWVAAGREHMSSATAPRRLVDFFVGLFEHAFFVIAGFVLMVLGLGLGVTMIMLPVGLVIGLAGLAMFVGGFFARINTKT
jgi:hypothetical protein